MELLEIKIKIMCTNIGWTRGVTTTWPRFDGEGREQAENRMTGQVEEMARKGAWVVKRNGNPLFIPAHRISYIEIIQPLKGE